MKYLIPLLLLISLPCFSTPIITVQSTTPHLSKSDYSLSLVDTDSSEIIKSLDVAENLNKASHWFLSESGKYFIFYIDQRGTKTGRINIYSSTDLELLTSIETTKLLIDKTSKQPQLLKLSHDDSKLVFLNTSSNKLSELTLFNLSNQNVAATYKVPNKFEYINLNQSILVLSGYQKRESWISIFDIDSNKLLFNQTDPRTKYLIQQSNQYTYINKEHKSNKDFRYSTDIFDAMNRDLLANQFSSNIQPQIASSNSESASFIAINTEDSIKIFKLESGQFNELAEDKSGSILKGLYLLADTEELAVLKQTASEDQIDLYDINNFQIPKNLPAAIDFELISHKKASNILWLKGKKLASLDLNTGKVLGVAPIGSTGAKVQKVLVGVTMAAISTSLAYAVFKGDGYNNIDFIINSTGDKVFVSSSVTDDISIFNSPNLENKQLHNVRENMLGLFKNNKNNIIGISKKSILFFDENEVVPYKIKGFEKLLGVDFENKLAYILINGLISSLSLESTELSKTFSIKNTIEVFIP